MNRNLIHGLMVTLLLISSAYAVKVGEPAPDFQATDSDGGSLIDKHNLRQTSVAVVYVAPFPVAPAVIRRCDQGNPAWDALTPSHGDAELAALQHRHPVQIDRIAGIRRQ